MTLSILALITAFFGTLAKLAPTIIDAVNKHYEKKANANVELAQAISSHDPQRSGPVLQHMADRLLRYKARLAALGRFQRPHS